MIWFPAFLLLVIIVATFAAGYLVGRARWEERGP